MRWWRVGRVQQTRTRQILLLVLLTALALAAAACSALWGTREPGPVVTLRQPTRVGASWEAILSVSNMPDGGIAGICIANGGISIDRAADGTTTVSGLNGFTVTAQDFAPPSPEGALMALGVSTPLIEGKLLKISFRTSDSNPTLTLEPSRMSLLSASKTWITDWTLRIVSPKD